MKSFRELFEEKKRVNAGPTKDAIEDARKKLVQQFNRPSRVTANPSGYTITNLPGGNIPDEQKFANLERLASQETPQSVAAASDVGPEARTQAANTAARARETRPGQRIKLGDTTRGGPVKVTQLKPTKPAPAPKPEAIKQSAVSAKAAAYRKKVAQQGEKVLRSLQRGQETTSRMGRGYSKSLARTGDAIISGIGAERKAETAAGKAEFKKLRYGKGKSGPATELRTPAQTKTYQTGVKKGYFNPKTGRVSETGIQKHVNMRTVGGENFGKMQGRDPRAELSRVSNITSRAAAGDKAARSEVRRSYKSITAKYKPETGARAGFGSSSFRTFQQQAATSNAPKLTPQKMSMPLPGTQQKPVSSPAAQATKEKLRQKLDLKLQAKPQKGGALGFPVETGITPSKSGKLAVGTKPGQLVKGTKGGELALGTKPGQLVAPSKPAATPSPSRQTTYTGIGGGKKVEVAGSPKTKTSLLTPGQQTTGTKPKEVKIPQPSKTPSVTPRKTYRDFVAQAGTTSTRKDSWSYSPQKSAEVSTPTEPKLSKKQQNPARYQREVQRRAKNISNIRSNKGFGGLGKLANVGFAAYDAYDVYKQQRKLGQSKEYATKRAISQAGGGAAGAWAGGKAGAALGTAVAGPVGGLVGGVLGGLGGYAVGSGAGKALVGASEKDKQWMRKTNRQIQTGTTADKAQFKTGNKSIITDKTGQERVGYKAFKGGKTVYKHANKPESLRYTSSNPLERLGRTIAGSNLGPVSDWMKSRYAASDAAARKKKITSVKTAASK